MRRVCYDQVGCYLLINLGGMYYHYCEIDTDTVDALIAAPSVGTYFNTMIKGYGSDGPFDCRTHKILPARAK